MAQTFGETYIRLLSRRFRFTGKMAQLSVSIFLLTLTNFSCYQETNGDSSLQADSNTVVGKPQLGKKNKEICEFRRDSGAQWLVSGHVRGWAADYGNLPLFKWQLAKSALFWYSRR